ncbi:hypothetical protein PENSPDRAFT_586614 [Peniophora sp. CONT]|nr:hypothetical protein PENSPDRAFT_586614 [Peniophora sp. CONT]
MASNDQFETEAADFVVEEEEEEAEVDEGEQEEAGDEDDDAGAGAQDQTEDGDQDAAAQSGSSKPKRKPKAPGSNQLNRQYGGKALLPVSRVQKIIKADKVSTVGRESIWVISRATEEFIGRMMQGGYNNAVLDKHNTVSVNDLVKVIRREDEYSFLDEIIAPMAKEAPARRAPGGGKGKKAEEAPQGQSMLDGFVSGRAEDEPEEDDGDVVMDENGAMSFVPRADP